jgi:hypothetical protein
MTQPIVVNLGKKKKKPVKRLLRGEGELYTQSIQALDQVKASLGTTADGKKLVPVIVVYGKRRKKRSRNRALDLPLPF